MATEARQLNLEVGWALFFVLLPLPLEDRLALNLGQLQSPAGMPDSGG